MGTKTAASLALVATLTAGCGGARRCPAPAAGERDAYLPRLSSSSGPAGSTMAVAGRLPLFDEAGKYVGPGTPHISAYWNLDLDHWTSILRTPMSPSASVAGSPVERVGTHRVTQGCRFRMQIRIPPARAGTYPLAFLYRYRSGTAPNGPVKFRVIKG